MATEILRPNAPGDECNLGNSGCSACPNTYDCVYEEVPDELGSAVYAQTRDVWFRDLYNIGNSSGNGTINKITLYFRTRSFTQTAASHKGVIKSGETVDETAEKHSDDDWGSAQWGTYAVDWTTDPNTDEAWTWDAIDNLQAGVSIYHDGGSPSCTQIYVEVDYTEVAVTNMKINISDVFKDIESLKINIGDAWKNVIKVQQNIGDVWKTVFG